MARLFASVARPKAVCDWLLIWPLRHENRPGYRRSVSVSFQLAGRLAVRDVRFGAHPLHLAAALGDVGMVRLIISKGAFVQVRCSGSEDFICN